MMQELEERSASGHRTIDYSVLYIKEDFECIYGVSKCHEILQHDVEIKDNGVFAKEVNSEFLDWMPCCELDDGPNPQTAPLLPFPFTAKELTAFMLCGWGNFFVGSLGQWEDGPWQEVLDEFPVRGAKAKEAVIAAFQAYRDAKETVGTEYFKKRHEEKRLHAEYELTVQEANASEKVSEQSISGDERELRRARAEVIAEPAHAKFLAMRVLADKSEKVWRKAMVVQLLNTSGGLKPNYLGTESVSANANATKQPKTLATTEIASAFHGIKWNEKAWKKALGDKPKWLKECIATDGVQGKAQTLWNPVLIGAALVAKFSVDTKRVRAKFQTAIHLTPWLDAWKTYESSNISD
jgi:hypothetical protein